MRVSVLEQRSRRGQGRTRHSVERGIWVCDNCAATTAWPRRRCGDCGTSRY